MTIKELIQHASNPSIRISKHLEEFPKNVFQHTTELIKEIENARRDRNDRLLEILLLAALRDGLNNNYTNILCQLLPESWHYSHEDIIMMLEEIKDPSSVESLYQTAVNIPDYDDGRGLARKCIWALGAINIPGSREKLVLLKDMNDPIISEVATMEFHGKTNQN